MASHPDVDNGFVFDLEGSGQGGFYRVPMRNRLGEVNRHPMVNTGEKFQVLAYLLDAVHGKIKDGCDDGTLLIASFSFLPTAERRFKNVRIQWKFESDDPAREIEVEAIAPEGSWSLNPTKRTDENSLTLTGNIGPSAGPVAGSGGGEYTMKTTQEKDFHTVVTGSRRIRGPGSGMPNTALWYVEENPDGQKKGIARTLHVGVLLKRTALSGKTPKVDTFRGSVEIVAEKDFWSQRASDVKRVWKKPEENEAIMFQPGKDRISGMFEIDKNSLADVGLEDNVMFMSLHQSFEDLKKEREERKKKKKEEEEEERKKKEEEEEEEEEEEKKKKQAAAPAAPTQVANPQSTP
jgi:hypothetical protein